MNWTRALVSAGALAACSWLATTTVLTQGGDASAQLRAAMHRETVQGDLNGAITEYRRIADGNADRAVQAQALLRLGAAYEKLGRPEARATYERVVRSYADQPKVATAAKARLAKVGGGAAVVKKAQADVTPRRIVDGHEANLTDVTPDGRLATGVVPGGHGWDVVIRDLTTGAVRLLVPGDTGGPSVSQPRISDDGSQVAYTCWWKGDTETIRVVSTQPGATPRAIVSTADVNLVVLDWAPDGRSVLVRVSASHDLAWLDLASGALRAIRHFDGRQPADVFMSPRISPDGRHIAFIAPSGPASTDMYVHVIDAAGHQESTVVATAGTRRQVMWTPDGGQVLYLEGSYHRSALWAIPVRAGQRAGEPTMLQAHFDGFPLAVASDGSLLAHRRNDGDSSSVPMRMGDQYLYLTDRRPSAGAQVSRVKSSGGTLSKDGRALAYIVWSGGNGSLIVRDLASGSERTYPHPALRDSTPIWREDGSALIVTTARGQELDPAGDRTTQSVDLRSGTYTELFHRGDGGYLRSRGALSPDGKTMYMARMNQARTAIADLVARDLATAEERVLTTIDAGPSRDPNAAVAISPDGRTLAVAYWNVYPEDAHLFTIGVDGTGRREVVASFPTAWIVNALSWNPDGQSIVFIGFDVQKNWRVMRVSAAGGTPEPDGLDYDTLNSLLGDIRLFPGNFNSFSLSHDGAKIATTTMTMAKTEVWALDVMALLAR